MSCNDYIINSLKIANVFLNYFEDVNSQSKFHSGN